MIALTRKTDYALVALAGLASDAPACASAHVLAERLRLPLPALRNILKVLARHGIVASTQGPAGGYRLARPAQNITLAEVVQAIEGPIRLTICCGNDGDGAAEQHCRLEDSCRIKTTVRAVHRQLMEFLGKVNLAQIAAGEIGNTTESSAEAQRAQRTDGEFDHHLSTLSAALR